MVFQYIIYICDLPFTFHQARRARRNPQHRVSASSRTTLNGTNAVAGTPQGDMSMTAMTRISNSHGGKTPAMTASRESCGGSALTQEIETQHLPQ